VGRGRLTLARLKRRARRRQLPSEDTLLALLLFGGIGLFAAGFGWWVHPALALILLGAALIGIAFLWVRSAPPPAPAREADEPELERELED
jgi:hypothetical protein